MLTREAGWVYGTKVTTASGGAYGGFQWPQEVGPVYCPDWNPEPVCGGGLHFWEDGCGDLNAATITAESQWRLVRAKEKDVCRLDGKVKAKAVEVLVISARDEVCRTMSDLAPGKRVNYGTATAGDEGTATAGYRGTATAGYRGTATAGNYGTATAGNYGTATAGNYGTATAGNYGTATAGDEGVIQIEWWDEKKQRKRIVIAYVGEDDIQPAVAYKLDANGKFVRA